VKYQVLDALGLVILNTTTKGNRKEEIYLPPGLAPGQYLLKYYLSTGEQGFKKFSKI